MTFMDLLSNGFANQYIINNGRVIDNTGTFLIVLAVSLCIVIGYLIGSLNFAILVSKKLGKDDVRNHGSKNAGTTNMLRTYGKKAALMTFLGDFLKAIVACSVGRLCFGVEGAYIAGLFCVIGHIFPIFFKFKGGKGVATTAGVMLACDGLTFLVILVLYVGVFLLSHFVSAASIMSALLYPFILYKLNAVLPEGMRATGLCILLALAIGVIVIAKHTGNLRRIFEGTEPKTYLSKKKKDQVQNKKSLHSEDDN